MLSFISRTSAAAVQSLTTNNNDDNWEASYVECNKVFKLFNIYIYIYIILCIYIWYIYINW